MDELSSTELIAKQLFDIVFPFIQEALIVNGKFEP